MSWGAHAFWSSWAHAFWPDYVMSRGAHAFWRGLVMSRGTHAFWPDHVLAVLASLLSFRMVQHVVMSNADD